MIFPGVIHSILLLSASDLTSSDFSVFPILVIYEIFLHIIQFFYFFAKPKKKQKFAWQKGFSYDNVLVYSLI